jgi:hypothetical protein
MKNFSYVRLPCKSLNFMVLEYLGKKSQNPHSRKIFMTIFVFVGQFFFQNDIYKLQENFSEPGIRIILENGIGSFQTRGAKKISKNCFENWTQNQRIHVDFGFPEPLTKGIFSVFGRFIDFY